MDLESTDLKRYALALLIIGGLNWGLVAVQQKDIFALLDLHMDVLGVPLPKIVYALVGLAAVFMLKDCMD